jgi:hypothetical protein
MVSSLQVFWLKFFKHFSQILCVLHVNLILLTSISLTLFGEGYKYSPQHPVCKLPQSMLSLSVRNWIHTHTKQQVKLWLMYFKLQAFREEAGGQKSISKASRNLIRSLFKEMKFWFLYKNLRILTFLSADVCRPHKANLVPFWCSFYKNAEWKQNGNILAD